MLLEVYALAARHRVGSLTPDGLMALGRNVSPQAAHAARCSRQRLRTPLFFGRLQPAGCSLGLRPLSAVVQYLPDVAVVICNVQPYDVPTTAVVALLIYTSAV